MSLAEARRADPASQFDSSGGGYAGMRAYLVCAGSKIHATCAQRLALCGHFNTGLCGTRRRERDVNGKALSAENFRRHANRLENQARTRTAGEWDHIDGHAPLLCLPDGAGDATHILVAIGNQQNTRHQAGRQSGQSFAHSGFQIGGRRRLSLAISELPHFCGALVETYIARDAREG